MANYINNGSKSPAFSLPCKYNQMGRVDSGIKNKDLRKAMKKFYNKKRRGNLKYLDYGTISSG